MKRGKFFSTDNYKELKKNIGEQLKKAREEKGMIQQEVADLIGVTQSQYNHYESGRTLIGLDQLLILHDLFDKPIGFFLGQKFMGDLSPTTHTLIVLLEGLSSDDRERILDYADYVVEHRRKKSE